ncbi:MAG: CapA family protein [Bacteroidales bacterium]|nr:CapA family protein [Bacteroidales bacterium]
MKLKFCLTIYFIIILFSGCINKKISETINNKGVNLSKFTIITSENRPEELSILFIGDIMQHNLQIQSAYRKETDSYDFSGQFEFFTDVIKSCDITIANLEVSFGGAPYSGYPGFSCPDELITAIKNAGINYLVTANNHVYDNDKYGFNRTIDLIDNAGIHRTGIYKNKADKTKNNPMIINEKGFKIAVFNYTYGVNLYDTKPSTTIVNIFDKNVIERDLTSVKDSLCDIVIVFMHWGQEYERMQNESQEEYAEFCFQNGADLVIGSHPHVIQPFERYDYVMPDGSKKDVLLAYSLGNFISNYDKWRYCDGGATLKVKFTKSKNKKVQISEAGYILIWVYKVVENNILYHRVLPVSKFENDETMSNESRNQMNRFINDSRNHLDSNNINMHEYLFDNIRNEWIIDGKLTK